MKKKDPKTETPQERKAAKIERERAVFQMACIRRGFTANTGPTAFKVARTTYWAWMNDRRKIPHSAFVRLIELENQMPPEQWERIQAMKKLADKQGLDLFQKPMRKPRKAKTQTDKE